MNIFIKIDRFIISLFGKHFVYNIYGRQTNLPINIPYQPLWGQHWSGSPTSYLRKVPRFVDISQKSRTQAMPTQNKH